MSSTVCANVAPIIGLTVGYWPSATLQNVYWQPKFNDEKLPVEQSKYILRSTKLTAQSDTVSRHQVTCTQFPAPADAMVVETG